MGSELVLAANRKCVEVSWKMENASGNLTRAEKDNLEGKDSLLMGTATMIP